MWGVKKFHFPLTDEFMKLPEGYEPFGIINNLVVAKKRLFGAETHVEGLQAGDSKKFIPPETEEEWQDFYQEKHEPLDHDLGYDDWQQQSWSHDEDNWEQDDWERTVDLIDSYSREEEWEEEIAQAGVDSVEEELVLVGETHWVCVKCFLNTRFGFEGTECEYTDNGFHSWITENVYRVWGVDGIPNTAKETIVRPEPMEWMTGNFVNVDTTGWIATPTQRSAPMGSEPVPDPALEGWKMDYSRESLKSRLHWDDECEWGGCKNCTPRRAGSGSGYVGPRAYGTPPVNAREEVDPILQEQWDRIPEGVITRDKEYERSVTEQTVDIQNLEDKKKADRHSFNDPETRDYARPDVSVKDDGYSKSIGGHPPVKGFPEVMQRCPSCNGDITECNCG